MQILSVIISINFYTKAVTGMLPQLIYINRCESFSRSLGVQRLFIFPDTQRIVKVKFQFPASNTVFQFIFRIQREQFYLLSFLINLYRFMLFL